MITIQSEGGDKEKGTNEGRKEEESAELRHGMNGEIGKYREEGGK